MPTDRDGLEVKVGAGGEHVGEKGVDGGFAEVEHPDACEGGGVVSVMVGDWIDVGSGELL